MRLYFDARYGALPLVNDLNTSLLVSKLGSERGQTSLEYLMLLAMTFIVAYIMVRGPVARFTQGIFETLFTGIQNVVENAEWSADKPQFNQSGHPSDQRRLKPLHL